MTHRMQLLSTLLLAVAFAAVFCLAQSSFGGGRIPGAVKDATGGVIPNAKLMILH